MKAARILQVIIILVVIGYLLVLHNTNPQPVILPYMLPLPTSVVVAIALLLGWLAGWLPSRFKVWRLNRENRKLRLKLEKLEPGYTRYSSEEASAPVIPDRSVTADRKNKASSSNNENI